WDVATGTLTTKPDGLPKWNNGVAALGSDRLLTTSVNAQQRVALRLWTTGPLEPATESILLAPAPATLLAPRGLALASSRENEVPDLAAVVAIGKFDGANRACLHVVSLDARQPEATVPLWPYEGRSL